MVRCAALARARCGRIDGVPRGYRSHGGLLSQFLVHPCIWNSRGCERTGVLRSAVTVGYRKTQIEVPREAGDAARRERCRAAGARSGSNSPTLRAPDLVISAVALGPGIWATSALFADSNLLCNDQQRFWLLTA